MDKAAKVALQTVMKFLQEEADSLKEVTFILFDNGTYAAYKKALQELLHP